MSVPGNGAAAPGNGTGERVRWVFVLKRMVLRQKQGLFSRVHFLYAIPIVRLALVRDFGAQNCLPTTKAQWEN